MTRAHLLVLGWLALAALCVPAQAQTPPAYSNDRWNEDWAGADAPLKDIQLAPGIALDFGADARWKAQGVNAPRLGLGGADDSWLLQRLLAHAHLRFDDDAAVFVELGAHEAFGKENLGGADANDLDIQQAFLDLTPSAELRLRVGRQEVALHERFLDPADTGNIRNHYDGARFTWDGEAWLIEAILIDPVRNEPETFDDDPVRGEHIHGGFAERAFAGGAARVFYYDHAREALALAGVTANDRRRTYGLTFNATRSGVESRFEIARQDGAHGAFDVEAWGAYAELARRFTNLPLDPRIGARLTYGSGDSDPNDGVLETYAPPMPRGSWFSEGGFTSHANTLEAATIIDLPPREGVTFSAKFAGLWRADAGDFVYVSSQTALPGTRGGDAFIGVSTRLQVDWRVNRHISARGQIATVSVSDDLRARGADDAAYAGAQIAFRY